MTIREILWNELYLYQGEPGTMGPEGDKGDRGSAGVPGKNVS